MKNSKACARVLLKWQSNVEYRMSVLVRLQRIPYQVVYRNDTHFLAGPASNDSGRDRLMS